MSTNRCHKFLVIWKEGKYNDRYFRVLVDPATESGAYELLKLTHNRFLLGDQYVNDEEERAIMDVSVRLGLDGWSDIVTDFLGDWAKFEIPPGSVTGYMGWDRIFVTGVAPQK